MRNVGGVLLVACMVIGTVAAPATVVGGNLKCTITGTSGDD